MTYNNRSAGVLFAVPSKQRTTKNKLITTLQYKNSMYHILLTF